MVQQLELFPPTWTPRSLSTPAPAAPFIRQSETSKGAARAIASTAQSIRARVLKFIVSKRGHGCTDEEIYTALNLASNTGRPRRCELVAAGLVIDSGHTRPTISGRAAAVWIISPKVSIYENTDGR